MPRYANHSGTSDIVSYEVEPTAIHVRFANGVTYVYDERKPGSHVVEQMKRLATHGRGLGTYINEHIKKNYSRKFGNGRLPQ
jgi:hypothetical protein